MTTQLFWIVDERQKEGPILLKPLSQVTLADVKQAWDGPPALFLFRTFEPSLKTEAPGEQTDGTDFYSWTVVTEESQLVTPYNDDSILFVKVRPLQRPTTTLIYHIEGHEEPLQLTVFKPASEITLADLKEHYPGPDVPYLVKTPEATHSEYHWTVTIDHSALLPSFKDEVVVHIKRKTPGTHVELWVEGDRQCSYLHFAKPPSEVTLRDIKPFYAGPPGLFFFKTPDTTESASNLNTSNPSPSQTHCQNRPFIDASHSSHSYHWTLVTAELAPLPYINDTISIKVKPLSLPQL